VANTTNDVLRMVNDSRFGLQAGIFTNDIRRAMCAFETLDVGAVLINQVPTWRVEGMPYGGIKDSGLGREGLRYALEEMTELQSLIIRKGSHCPLHASDAMDMANVPLPTPRRSLLIEGDEFA